MNQHGPQAIMNQQGPRAIMNQQGPRAIMNQQGPQAIMNQQGPRAIMNQCDIDNALIVINNSASPSSTHTRTSFVVQVLASQYPTRMDTTGY